MKDKNIKSLLESKATELTLGLEDFAKNVLKLPYNKRLVINLAIETIPELKAQVVVGRIKARLQKGKLLEDPLNEVDWEKIESMDFSEKQRIIINFFRENGNQLTSLRNIPNLVLGWLRNSDQVRLSTILAVFNKYGGTYGLRSSKYSNSSGKSSQKYRIYKIER